MKESLYRMLTHLFTVTLILFMMMGGVYVAVQIVGIIIGSGALVLGIEGAVKDLSTYVSAICGFVGFVAFYLKPDKK